MKYTPDWNTVKNSDDALHIMIALFQAMDVQIAAGVYYTLPKDLQKYFTVVPSEHEHGETK